MIARLHVAVFGLPMQTFDTILFSSAWEPSTSDETSVSAI